jgi:hypothetical protein
MSAGKRRLHMVKRKFMSGSNVVRVHFQAGEMRGSIWKTVERPAWEEWEPTEEDHRLYGSSDPGTEWTEPQSPEEWLEYLDACLDADEEPVGLPDDLPV